MSMTIGKPFGCVHCKYFCSRKANLQKHLTSKKHQLNSQIAEKDENCKHQCKVCSKKYLSQSGLWGHNQLCKPVVAALQPSAKIDNLERIMLELVKNQQPTTINNNNSINNTNYINIFLNRKCRNACDITKFIAGIDFSKENYQNILMDYVGGNAEIITKSYKRLPEFERPVYSFSGEDEHQKVAHIQHDDKWIVERELSWTNQVRREYNDGVNDDPEPNSMYSLVRLFDKKKMEYFDKNYKQSHLYLSSRKFNNDCLDDGKQLELIHKIIEMAVVET